MTRIDEIEEAVSGLSPRDLAKFRAWFEAFDAEKFDQRIESDAVSGKLDALAEKARADFREGRIREI